MRLDAACTQIVDCEHKTAPIDEGGEFFAVGTPAMRNHRINYAEARRISRQTFETWTRRLSPRPGDLLLAREAPVGPVVRLPDVANVAPGQRTVLLRPDPRAVDSAFLYYALTAPAAQVGLKVKAEGSTVHHLNVPDIRSFEVWIPGLSEQQAIAEVLGAIDDKIAANTALAGQAEGLAALTYDSTVASWSRVAMSQVLEPILGGTPARARDEYWEGGDQLWISARDITSAHSRVVLDTAEKITLEAVAKTKAKALPAGSVVLTARGTVGAVGRLARPASFNQSCYGFRADSVPPSLLYFSILRASERAKAVAHGSVFDTVTKATFDHLELSWDASRAAQAELRLAPLLGIVTASVEENRTLAAIRDTLLPQLMSGKLRVRDAETAASEAGA